VADRFLAQEHRATRLHRELRAARDGDVFGPVLALGREVPGG
jgi:hypothetical protein